MALIYAVEDDKNILEIEMFALKNSGYQVEGFECAHDFYKKLEEKQPDLVLLDIMLPEEDGLSMEQLSSADDTLDRLLEEQDICMLLQNCKRQYTGTARLGIEAIEWKVKGLSGAEIAKMYGVKPNLVGAWISRAAGRLKQNRDFMQYFDRPVEMDSS